MKTKTKEIIIFLAVTLPFFLALCFQVYKSNDHCEGLYEDDDSYFECLSSGNRKSLAHEFNQPINK